MHSVAGLGSGFLLAVLWFDLMFDVQVRRHPTDVPDDVLDSIAAYYRRVTTTARPMNRLVAAMMLVTVAAIVVEVVRSTAPRWASIPSLLLVSFAIGLAAARTVRLAVRLGTQVDDQRSMAALARSVYRDHVFCFVAIAITAILQIAG